MSGLSTTGSISFGLALVAGKKRVPSPATGKTALVTFFIFLVTPASIWSNWSISTNSVVVAATQQTPGIPSAENPSQNCACIELAFHPGRDDYENMARKSVLCDIEQ